ncbi:MAG: hypothetical protein E7425_06725 [Ruminococcaceae bacterium]|nr:hypothetical protein [Oscillospiraceae bacterium]
MKHTSKPLSVLLTLALVLGLLPWTVLPARADGDIAQIGSDKYATFEEAAAACTSAAAARSTSAAAR